ncbi:uncharacterized protein ARMOST_08830 [Armillaria ostoyae]|uniref:Uncharacterized protein n=1 Tax=Armillaria ostoyae TaxID=47428 RepID=A0A284R9T4_ARMOS|nr:uncharacterized protein ARMOST_08830 [Armillaria ostoyae]
MENMDVDSVMQSASSPVQQVQDGPSQGTPAPPTLGLPRENFRDIQVKVHIRRPERDSWVYLGRGIVSQEVVGHSSRIVVRNLSSNKVITSFGEGTDLQAERRGNFVVIGCVEGARVVSWSLNALNNSDTLRLIASIELACYKSKQALTDPRLHSKTRRRIERVIKDDRRKRHRRRKDQEALVDAFAKQNLSNSNEPISMNADGDHP